MDEASPGTPDYAFSFLPEVRMLREVLRKVGFLSKLNMEGLEILLERMRRMPVVQNTEVVRQGDTKADAFYIVARGRCSVWKLRGTAMEKIDELGPGTFFGERALITEGPRAATVKTETFTELYVLYKDEFKAALLNNPEIAADLKRHIEQYKP